MIRSHSSVFETLFDRLSVELGNYCLSPAKRKFIDVSLIANRNRKYACSLSLSFFSFSISFFFLLLLFCSRFHVFCSSHSSFVCSSLFFFFLLFLIDFARSFTRTCVSCKNLIIFLIRLHVSGTGARVISKTKPKYRE